jgi:hypothetical protein
MDNFFVVHNRTAASGVWLWTTKKLSMVNWGETYFFNPGIRWLSIEGKQEKIDAFWVVMGFDWPCLPLFRYRATGICGCTIFP